MLALVFWSLALGLAFAIGAHDGRERERRRIASGKLSQWEADLLRARGNRVHPNPQMAGRSSVIRIRR